MKTLATLLILIVLSTSSISAQDVFNFEVTPSDPTAGAISDYDLSFDLSLLNYAFLNKGKIQLEFPEGFNLLAIDHIEISDNLPNFDYTVKSFSIDNTTLLIGLTCRDDVAPLDTTSLSTHLIPITISISSIRNPIETGHYQLAMLGIKWNNKIYFGPDLSDRFEIKMSPLVDLHIIPDTAIKLTAGDSFTFNAQGVDQYGNLFELTDLTWRLIECDDCIGSMSGATLNVIRIGTGRVEVSTEELADTSGLITVIAGPLSRLALHIESTQYVGQPLVGDVSVVLYDAFDNLVTDFDLTESPLTLSLGEGSVTPSVIADNDNNFGGVVRLNDIGVTYTGPSSTTSISASIDAIVSNERLIAFNRYDILDVLADDSTIDLVYRNISTRVTVKTLNDGNKTPVSTVTISAMFSGGSETTWTTFLPGPTGTVQETMLQLPVINDERQLDTLIITTLVEYVVDGSMVTIADTKRFPIQVAQSAVLSYEDNSLVPDSVLAGRPFAGGFAITSENSMPLFDSAFATIKFLNDSGKDTIFSGVVTPGTIEDKRIVYNDLPCLIDTTELQMANGQYPIEIEFIGYTENSILSFITPGIDSLYIIFDPGVRYIPGTFSPQLIYAGSDVRFVFQLEVDSELPLIFHGQQSFISVFDETLSMTTVFDMDEDTLLNGTYYFMSLPLSISSSLINKQLTAKATFNFCIQGIMDSLIFVPDFGSDGQLTIVGPASAQIIDLYIEAPNSPRVNTDQEFDLFARIANTGESVIDSLHLNLVSVENASLILTPNVIVTSLQPDDTVTVPFTAQAAAQANSLPERFRVDITSTHLVIENPVNNSAFLFIDEPAELNLVALVNGELNNLNPVVDYGSQINLLVSLLNQGRTDVSLGEYRLIVTGLPNGPDTVTGVIEADSVLAFAYVAPQEDAQISIAFEVTTIPLDINSAQPAMMDEPSLDFTVSVVSTATEMLAEVHPLGTNLILPERQQDIFTLTLSNTGAAAAGAVAVKEIHLGVLDLNGNPLDSRDLFVIGNTNFIFGNQPVGQTTSDQGQLHIVFDDLIFAPDDEATLTFTGELKPTATKTFRLRLATDDISAVFAEGPNQGLPVQISSVTGASELLNRTMNVKGSSLDESFIIENNPFNPMMGPVEFSFELSVPTDIEFRVYTLTGELVSEVKVAAGQIGAQTGENAISWDGRNNNGDMVLNGVYIAEIYNAVTRETARMKVALLK